MGEEAKNPEAEAENAPAPKAQEEKKEVGEEEEKEGGDQGEKKEEGGIEDVKKEEGGEEKKEESAAEPPPPPPAPAPEEVVMKVYMHCEGCARKVRRCLRGFPGVEEVVADYRAHMVVVKGRKAAEAPLKVVERVQRKSRRTVELISPIPPSELEKREEAKEEETPKPAVVVEEPKVISVVLKVHMHCEACSQEIKKRIIKMKGIHEAEPDLKSSEVAVKGVFEPSKLVEYVYRKTGKHAVVMKVDPPLPEEKPAEEAAVVEAKPEGEAEKKVEEGGEEKPKEEETDAAETEKKEEEGGEGGDEKKKEEDAAKEKEEEGGAAEATAVPAANIAAAIVDGSGKVVGVMRKNEFYYYYPTRYPVEYSYPPQIFSDENPNACTVM